MNKKKKIKIRDLYLKKNKNQDFFIDDFVLVDFNQVDSLSEGLKKEIKELIKRNDIRRFDEYRYINNKIFDVFYLAGGDYKLQNYYVSSKYYYLERIYETSRTLISEKRFRNQIRSHKEKSTQETRYPLIGTTQVFLLPDIILKRVYKLNKNNLFFKINKNNKLIIIEY